ncbi:hypothetical protein F5I97DRAFT_1300844 [Phlebopus sp. FC_14]|nr:hypothetical protein F5I97DRAFT_1300844 [Phlebopus sp. FC_14]
MLGKLGRIAMFAHLPSFRLPCQSQAGALSGLRLDALRKGLSATYRGPAVNAFCEYLNQNHQAFYEGGNERYYGKFCSIVQSSGTGKTRLMLELATKGICVLYMNIRSANDKQGYPYRDDVPANILTGRCDTQGEYFIRCRAFFASIFKVLRIFLEEQKVFNDWCMDMCKIGSGARDLFFAALGKEYENVKEEMRSLPTEEVVLKKYYLEMVKTFLRVRKAFWLVIALDESHVLHSMEDLSEPFLRAVVVPRIIKEYSQYSTEVVWVLFGSTTSKVVHFASPQALFPSARVAVEGQLVFPPFTQLGWDQNTPALDEVRPDEVGKAEHVLRYGRPLWASLKEGCALLELLMLARDKLCGKPTFDPKDAHQAFAVLAQRFGLDIAFGHRDAVRNVETSVASHLRVCIKPTEDRIWSYSSYPSEPFLSCAAASLLHDVPRDKDYWARL